MSTVRRGRREVPEGEGAVTVEAIATRSMSVTIPVTFDAAENDAIRSGR